MTGRGGKRTPKRKRVVKGVRPRKYKRVHGEPPKEIPERPPLSAIEVIEHVPLPDDMAQAIHPSEKTLERHSLVHSRYLAEKAAKERERTEGVLGQSVELDEEARAKLVKVREEFKSMLDEERKAWKQRLQETEGGG